MKKIIFLFSILFLNSCIKTVEIEIPKDKPKQVLNCLFTANDRISASINNSIPILEEDYSIIDNANIILYEDDIEIETLVYDDGVYKSTTHTQYNKVYKIESSVLGFETIIAEDVIPKQPTIINIGFVEWAYYDPNYEGFFGKTSITIEDNGNQTNYFEVLVVRRFYFNDEIITRPTSIEVTSDPVVSNELDVQNYPTHLVFTDKSFNGSTHTITFDFVNHYNEEDSPINYKVIINSISENYYLYKRRLNRHTDFQKGYIGDIFIEPIQMYTNVENGFGIFAGYNEYSQMFYH
ncbi:MAG TPA: DUF4249 domain-containing protein [Lutibacter sp.]|nr:DUF4249 domain-containing protein [Lutibacter sp.]